MCSEKRADKSNSSRQLQYMYLFINTYQVAISPRACIIAKTAIPVMV
jgi:hypothetical protein